MLQRLRKQAWRELKDVLRPVKRRLFGPVPRARNDYATHVPVLIGLARVIGVKAALELGCGQFSTLAFLNPSAFPHLEKLVSAENDLHWNVSMARAVAGDARAAMKFVDGEMTSFISRVDIDAYDLLLIDDSADSEQRSATIQLVAQRKPERALVVIHDFEVEAYRIAASSFRHRYIFTAYNPQTAVVWNSKGLNKVRFKRMDSVIKQKAKALQPDDVAGWIKAFDVL